MHQNGNIKIIKQKKNGILYLMHGNNIRKYNSNDHILR